MVDLADCVSADGRGYPPVEAARKEISRDKFASRKIISRVKEGSMHHIMALALDVSKVAKTMVQEALEVLSEYLDESALDSLQGDFPRIVIAYSVLKTVLRRDFLRDAPSSGHLVVFIEKNWAKCFAWMQRIYAECVSSDIPENARERCMRSEAIDIFSGALFAFQEDRNLCSKLMANSTSRKFIAQLCLAYDPSGMADRIPYGVRALSDSINKHSGSGEAGVTAALDDVLEAAGGSAYVTAMTLIHHLRNAIRSKADLKFHTAVAYLELLFTLTRDEEHRLFHVLLCNRVVPVMSRATDLLSQINSFEEAQLNAAVVQICFGSFRHFFYSTDIIQWIKQGVEHGLFRVYVNLASRFFSRSTKSLTTAKGFLSELAVFFMHRPVLRATSKGLEELTPHCDSILEKTFENEWRLFRMLLLERLVIRSHLDHVETILGFTECCDICGTVQERRTLKRCARCRRVYYCSVRCQRDGWKTQNHSSICEERASESDAEFLVYLATVDVRRHLPGLRKLAANKFPDVPFGHIGFEVRYTKVPVTFDIFRLDELGKRVSDLALMSVAKTLIGWDKRPHEARTFLCLVTRAGVYNKSEYFESHRYLPLVVPEIKATAPGELKGKPRSPQGLDSSGVGLETVYDEYDEIMSRLEQAATVSRRTTPEPRWLWEEIDDQTWVKDTDWPFENPLTGSCH